MNRYIKERIIFHYHDLVRRRGHFHGIYTSISRILAVEERKVIDRRFVRQTVITKNVYGDVYWDRKGLGRPNRLTNNDQIRDIIEESLQENDELTAQDITYKLESRGYSISVPTINRIKIDLDWTCKATRYCQMIRNANKPKRVQWVTENINDTFNDVIWTDETSVWMEQHTKKIVQKKGCSCKKKAKTKVSSETSCLGRNQPEREHRSLYLQRNHGRGVVYKYS